MKPVNRRDFMKKSMVAATTLTLASGVKTYAANEKVILGVMGLGGRGTQMADYFSQRPDVEIAYLCDPNTRRFARARETVEENQSRRPKLVQDFRRILEDKEVDALLNATPDHWHALGSIMACQAGKDVYVEKPMAHNAWEGRKMVEAARKYQRIIQVGTQTRSAPYIHQAREIIRSGELGPIHLVRVFNMMQHPFARKSPDQPVPAGFDYDLWCGPAAKQPYNPSRRWLNLWEYSCGPIPGDAVHQLDLARYLIDDLPFPKTVYHNGGIRALKDGRDTPDTQFVTYDFGELTMLFEAALWSPFMKKIPGNIRDTDKFPQWPFCSTKIEILGTKGIMYMGRHGGGFQVYNANDELTHSVFGRRGDLPHVQNFIECIRSRKRAAADVEIGHQSVMLCHLANASYRVGNRLLEFDPKTETVTNLPEANRYLKRTYRKPWVVPENV